MSGVRVRIVEIEKFNMAHTMKLNFVMFLKAQKEHNWNVWQQHSKCNRCLYWCYQHLFTTFKLICKDFPPTIPYICHTLRVNVRSIHNVMHSRRATFCSLLGVEPKFKKVNSISRNRIQLGFHFRSAKAYTENVIKIDM